MLTDEELRTGFLRAAQVLASQAVRAFERGTFSQGFATFIVLTGMVGMFLTKLLGDVLALVLDDQTASRVTRRIGRAVGALAVAFAALTWIAERFGR